MPSKNGLDFGSNPSIAVNCEGARVGMGLDLRLARSIFEPLGGASDGMVRRAGWSTTLTKKLQEKTPEPASPERAKKANQSTNAKKGPSAGSAVRKHNPQSKSDHVLALLRQADGASLNDLMKATRWQAHSVRGFLSGAVRKRKGLTVVSERDGQGTRRYRIAGEAGA